jgi:hypothetical protein
MLSRDGRLKDIFHILQSQDYSGLLGDLESISGELGIGVAGADRFINMSDFDHNLLNNSALVYGQNLHFFMQNKASSVQQSTFRKIMERFFKPPKTADVEVQTI